MPLRRTIGYNPHRRAVPSTALEHREAESECVQSLEYDIDTQQMTVHFWKRGSYTYFDVEPWQFEEFNLSSKRGSYFNLYIRPYYTNFERVL